MPKTKSVISIRIWFFFHNMNNTKLLVHALNVRANFLKWKATCKKRYKRQARCKIFCFVLLEMHENNNKKG